MGSIALGNTALAVLGILGASGKLIAVVAVVGGGLLSAVPILTKERRG